MGPADKSVTLTADEAKVFNAMRVFHGRVEAGDNWLADWTPKAQKAALQALKAVRAGDLEAAEDAIKEAQRIEGLSEARIDEARGSGRTWADFEGDALEEFHKEVAAGIKKLAGGHAESVEAERSRSTSWVSYKGQNRSDIDLEWTGTLITGTKDGAVLASTSWKAADGLKRVEREVRGRSGEITAQTFVDLFEEAFGR
jgi:hypothetical protein